MKIAIVYDLIYPYSIGGVESRNFSLAQELVLNGHEVHLFGVKSWTGNRTKKVTDNFYIHGISRYKDKYFKGTRRVFEPFKYSILLFFELMKHDFDIIDVSAFPYFPYFSCKLYSVFKHKPLIVTWHEVWDDYWQKYAKGFVGAIGRIVEKIAANTSKKNICISKLTAERFRKICKKRGRYETIENWVDIEELEKSGPLKEKFDIISVGRHLKHKNFELLIKICAILIKEFPKLRALIIGEGPQTIYLLKIIRGLKLENNIELLSFTKDKKRLYGYMKSSKIFVLLSELEGFSIVSFEAMACGLSVITLDSERNALKDYLPKENLCKKDALEISTKIRRLLRDRKFHKKNMEEMKKLASMFEKKEQIKKIIDYYCKN